MIKSTLLVLLPEVGIVRNAPSTTRTSATVPLGTATSEKPSAMLKMLPHCRLLTKLRACPAMLLPFPLFHFFPLPLVLTFPIQHVPCWFYQSTATDAITRFMPLTGGLPAPTGHHRRPIAATTRYHKAALTNGPLNDRQTMRGPSRWKGGIRGDPSSHLPDTAVA